MDIQTQVKTLVSQTWCNLQQGLKYIPAPGYHWKVHQVIPSDSSHVYFNMLLDAVHSNMRTAYSQGRERHISSALTSMPVWQWQDMGAEKYAALLQAKVQSKHI